MSRVVHFEISAREPEKVIAFYKSVFDWDVSKWEGPEDYWLVSTGPSNTPGIDGGFFRPRESFRGTINTVHVSNVEASMEKVKVSGGEVVSEKMAIPGVGYLAYCKDVEGTLFGIMQPDGAAAP